MTNRITERLVNGGWERITLSELVIGDTFRMFEPDNMGPVVANSGRTEFLVMCDPELIDGVWGVVIK